MGIMAPAGRRCRLLPLLAALALSYLTLARADCRVIGNPNGAAIWSCPAACSSTSRCTPIGRYWLPKGTFWDFTNERMTCNGEVFAKFRAAQGVGVMTAWIKAADAAYCSDYCDSTKTCTINSLGQNLVRSFEACCLSPYADSRNVCTIGWGHSANAPTPPKPSLSTYPISAATADSYLNNDLTYIEARVRALVRVPLTSNQFSAIVSWTFNGGDTLLARSKMLINLNAWDYNGARYELANGFPANLQSRKQAEQALFSGTYSAHAVPSCIAGNTGVCSRRCSGRRRLLAHPAANDTAPAARRALLQSSTCRQVSASALNLRDSNCNVVRTVPAGTQFDFYGTRQANKCQAGCDWVQVRYAGTYYWAAASCSTSTGTQTYIVYCPPPANCRHPMGALKGYYTGAASSSSYFVCGTPNEPYPESTHNPANPPNDWQSDNAYDWCAPAGTTVYAVEDGVVCSSCGFGGDTSATGKGLRFTLNSATNQYFYQHLGKLYVSPGQSVAKGAAVGTLFSFPSNTPHLHFAQRTNADGVSTSRAALGAHMSQCSA